MDDVDTAYCSSRQYQQTNKKKKDNFVLLIIEDRWKIWEETKAVMNERIGGEGMMMMTTKKRDYTHRWRARSSPTRTTDSNPTRYTQVSGSSTQRQSAVHVYTKAADVTDSHKHTNKV